MSGWGLRAEDLCWAGSSKDIFTPEMGRSSDDGRDERKLAWYGYFGVLAARRGALVMSWETGHSGWAVGASKWDWQDGSGWGVYGSFFMGYRRWFCLLFAPEFGS